MPSATIKIFLVHGDPKRLRTAELSNWTGKAVAGPRSEFDGVLAREEANNSGIYLLTGTDTETGRAAIYVGEAEVIKDRIKAHLAKDFWNQIIYFISKDENLTKAHIRYLEGKLIEGAQKANKAVVTNSQNSGAKLPESDREDMEVFLGKVNQLLPVLGVELLVPASSRAESDHEKYALYCDIKGIRAIGHLSPNGFVVLKDSQAVLAERASTQKYPWPHNMREQLKEEGTLVIQSDCLVFTRDREFSSPSAAASIIHGGHANGLTAWKDNQGKTLKEIELL
ncbi:MAG: GIY-YIG nuclease family protein [Desulfobulbaceae bacterium]|nr:GIY-YIG nuclease family protein [Desulfobulbaceae bacterium]